MTFVLKRRASGARWLVDYCKSLCVCVGEWNCNPTADGFQYVGRVSVTVTGRQCQVWMHHIPHRHSYTRNEVVNSTGTGDFADPSPEAAVNYCRNPDRNLSSNGLWCFTMDPDSRWEKCHAHSCGQSRDLPVISSDSVIAETLVAIVAVYKQCHSKRTRVTDCTCQPYASAACTLISVLCYLETSISAGSVNMWHINRWSKNIE